MAFAGSETSGLSAPWAREKGHLFCVGTDNSTRFVADSTRPPLVRQGGGLRGGMPCVLGACYRPQESKPEAFAGSPSQERTQRARQKLRRPADASSSKQTCR